MNGETTAPTERHRSRDGPPTTRQRLVDAAAEVFNDVGYWGTDSNRLARAAGYSPGTFYKHFADKREIFLAAYEQRGSLEWDEIRSALADPDGDALDRLTEVIEVIVEHHRGRIGLRQSLRALAATDPVVRDLRLEQRRAQLDEMAHLLERVLGTRPDPERCFLAMLMVERTCDAIADGDVATLGLDESQIVRSLAQHLSTLAEA